MHSNDELYKKFEKTLFDNNNFAKKIQVTSLSTTNEKEDFVKFYKKITLNETLKYAFIVLEEIKGDCKSIRMLSIIKKCLKIEIDAVCLICEEEDFIESNASNQLLDSIREQFKSLSNNFEKFFVKSYKNNTEFENICKDYRTDSNNRMWNLLNKVFENSRKISIPDNLENIYRFADWPNKVNFDLDLEIFECALVCW